MALSNYSSGVSMDLALNAKYQNDMDEEQKAAQKKRMKDQQARKAVPTPFGGAYMNLAGNQF